MKIRTAMLVTVDFCIAGLLIFAVLDRSWWLAFSAASMACVNFAQWVQMNRRPYDGGNF